MGAYTSLFRTSVATAVAFCALMLILATTAASQSIDTSDLDDLLPPVHIPREGPKVPGVRGTGNPYGQSRRIDQFDALEEEERSRTGSSAEIRPDSGQVTCLAGCDAPHETIADKKKSKPVASLLE